METRKGNRPLTDAEMDAIIQRGKVAPGYVPGKDSGPVGASKNAEQVIAACVKAKISVPNDPGAGDWGGGPP